MRSYCIIVLCTLYFSYANCAMSEAQMKAALKLVRNVCQPKFKATNEQIDAMHKGEWDQDRAGQCYMWCILNMYKLITKDNKFDWETGITTLNNQAPDSIRSGALQTLQNCKDSVKTPGDKCAAGFEIARCFYFDNPGNYFFP